MNTETIDEPKDGKLCWDAACNASRAAMERFLRALVVTRSHFTDSFTLAPINEPSRGVDVFFRVWIPVGQEQRFLQLAQIFNITPPPIVSVGMQPSPKRNRLSVENEHWKGGKRAV